MGASCQSIFNQIKANNTRFSFDLVRSFFGFDVFRSLQYTYLLTSWPLLLTFTLEDAVGWLVGWLVVERYDV